MLTSPQMAEIEYGFLQLEKILKKHGVEFDHHCEFITVLRKTSGAVVAELRSEECFPDWVISPVNTEQASSLDP